MPASGVTLLRARAASVLAAACLASIPAPLNAAPPTADGGGAPIGSGEMPGEPQPSAPSSVASADPTPLPPAPATQERVDADLPAPLVAPALAAPLRRPDDPVIHDLAGLAQPTGIAAIDGHVVIVRARGGQSELVDIADPAAPRILLSSTRAFGIPNPGRSTEGRPVIVVSPCAGTDDVILMHRSPNCPLRVVDLLSGRSSALPGSAGALEGDVAGDRFVFARQSPEVGVRLYARGELGVRPIALPATDEPEPDESEPDAPATPSESVPGSRSIGGIDVAADGRVAIVLDHRAGRSEFSSTLWLRARDDRWRRIISVHTPRDDLGVRRVLGPGLDDGGLRAYVEGVVDGPSFIGRWTDDGASTSRFSVRRSIGRATILRDAAFDGTRMVFVDWLPGLPCGSAGAGVCGLRALGPLPVR